MAIALRGTPQIGSANNGGDVTLTFDVTPVEGDYVVVFGGHAYRAAAPLGPSTAGYTTVTAHNSAEPAMGCWYKKQGATPDSTVVCQGTGDAADATGYCCFVLSGVDADTFLDVAVQTAGPTTSTNPDAPAITPDTTGSWILIGAGSSVFDASSGAVSGYTVLGGASNNETNDFSVDGGYNSAPTIGSSNDPPAWDSWASGTWYAITIVPRAAAAAAYSVTAELGSYAVTGIDAAGSHGYNVTADLGSYAVTGVDATLRVDRVVTGDVQSYASTGIDATLSYGQTMAADGASYAVTGFDASPLAAHALVADLGSYSTTGIDATLTYVSSSASRAVVSYAAIQLTRSATAAFSVSADLASYAITGIDAVLRRGLVAAADQASYTVNGIDATPLLGRDAVAGLGAYAITGIDATPAKQWSITAAEGTYAVNGIDAVLRAGRVVTADLVSYQISGIDATLTYQALAAKTITADLGAYQVTGIDVNALLARVLGAGEESYAITGIDASFTYTQAAAEEEAPRPGAGKRTRRRRPRFWWEDVELEEPIITPEEQRHPGPIVPPQVEMPVYQFDASPPAPEVDLAPIVSAMRKRGRMKLAAAIAMAMFDE